GVGGLGWGAVGVPGLEPCAIGGAAAGDVEAATRLRVHETVLVSPAPLLGAGAVAVPELDRRPVGGAAAGDVHALAEDTQRPVTAVPRPALRARAVARPALDRGAVVRTRTRVVDALTTVAADWPGVPVLRLDHRGRVEVVAGVDRLGEAQVLPLGPVERGGAARRPSEREAGDVRAVPDLLRHKVALVRFPRIEW